MSLIATSIDTTNPKKGALAYNSALPISLFVGNGSTFNSLMSSTATDYCNIVPLSGSVTLTNATYGSISFNYICQLTTVGVTNTICSSSFFPTAQPGIATIGPTTWTSTTNPFLYIKSFSSDAKFPLMFSSSTLGVVLGYATISHTTGSLTININYAAGAGIPTFLSFSGLF